MLDSMQIALIVNGKATRVTRPRIEGVEKALRRAGSVTVFETEHARHGIELARQASQEADAIVSFSGDGGFNEVLNGLGRDIPVGFVPGGGTSVLPRALGLPRDPIDAAAQIAAALTENRTRRISLGSVNGYRFAFEAGIGVDAEVVRRVDRLGRDEDGRRPGDFAFARSLISVLRERRRSDDHIVEVRGLGRAAFAVVCNGDPSTFAGPLPLRFAPAARFELGLDLVAPVRLRRRSIVRIAFGMLAGRIPRSQDAYYGHNLDRIEVVCDCPEPLHADGEDLGDVASAVFECQRSAVSVLL
ncbi:MAG: diacylglycerol kinase family protein [Gaiellaceae bacterium]|jgi:diacylglycerol kinase family enzyme